jgi:hypothetical protein
MSPSSSTQKAPPPLSLSTCWDKGKWHCDSSSFPAQLPRELGWSHIVAALRFLDERGQLTAAGKQELMHADEEIALLSEQIKAPARAFLDQSYEPYLNAMRAYDQPPPLHILEAAWDEYAAKYDLSKGPRANAFQQLLLDNSHDRTGRRLAAGPGSCARSGNAPARRSGRCPRRRP